MIKKRLTEKAKDCFGYRLKDGSDAEVGFFKDYNAFYSHMMIVRALGEYEDLEEQGLLLRLPCKVGDVVYKPNFIDGKVHEIIINEIYIYESEFDFNGMLDNKQLFHCKLEDFGKNVFLTQTEAEKRLRESNGKE